MSGCIGCLKTAKEKNEQWSKIVLDATTLANSTQGWVAIYADEYGEYRIIRAEFAGGYNVVTYITPTRDASV